MFTGIIEDLGILRNIELKKLTIETKLEGLKTGDSVNVNGICLTIINISSRPGSFSLITLEVMPETARMTTLNGWDIGIKVNLERAVPIGGRLGGHIVSGHVDGIGIINKIKREENAKIMEISTSKEITKFIAPKGSIAVDGISLTVVDIVSNSFTVSLTPYTIEQTCLNFKKENDKVNIETDILAKYIEQLIKSNDTLSLKREVTMDSLEKYGFI